MIHVLDGIFQLTLAEPLDHIEAGSEQFIAAVGKLPAGRAVQGKQTVSGGLQPVKQTVLVQKKRGG